MTYTGARLRREPRQQAAWEEQAFLAASSGLRWSADLFSSCRSSSGFPQGQGWAAAMESHGAFRAWMGQVYHPPVPGRHPRWTQRATAPARANRAPYGAEGKEGGHQRSPAQLLPSQHPGRGRETSFSGCQHLPASPRAQLLRGRIHASTALSTETLLPPALGLSPPLNMVKVGFTFTAEPPPSPFLMPFSS